MALVNGSMGIHAGQKNLVLAFDPGRDKTGFAFTNLDGRLILSGIFETGAREKFFDDLKIGRIDCVLEKISDLTSSDLFEQVKFVAIGNGTSSKKFTEYLKTKISCEVIIVDEKNTTLEARSLYWKIHQPSLLMRLLPEGLRVPARVLDDLAAWAIALRAVKKYRDISANKL